MNPTNRFSLTLHTLAKLAADNDQIHSAPLPALPSLNSVLAEFAPLPRTALFLGLATDGLPILLNLLDPMPGPLMIVGDRGCGKTNFLRTISSSINGVHSSNEVSFSIISSDLSEWQTFQNSSNCANLLSPGEPDVVSVLHSLVEWAHTNKGAEHISLLLIDRIETLLEIPETQPDLRWLLLRGPSRHIWPIVTISSAVAVSEGFRPWLEAFHTRLFGYFHDDHEAQILTGISNISFINLMSGFQFVMREGNDWLPFWIPILD
jgi:hypothetical protein